MKRISALLLALLLLVSTFALSPAEQTDTDEAEYTEEALEELVYPEYDLDSLTVAVANPFTGKFFTSLWGNNTSDIDVRLLIHGYSLVVWDVEQGMFRHDDTVINAIVATMEEDGSHTYTIVLNDDLYYSDGTQITAWDYAFSLLFSAAPELDDLGTNSYRPTWLVGYSEYASGESAVLSGVRVVSDDQLSISISADYLPYFYELGLLNVIPYPISVIAPGVRVADDGEGVYLTNADGSEGSLFTAELLRQTIFDEESGYLTHPSVTSGAYVLTSYEDGVAEFDLNPYYKNDPMGNTPTISHLTFKSLDKAELINALTEGSVGLLNKVSGTEEIALGMQLVSENEFYGMSTYPRTGLGFISLRSGNPALRDNDVRKAIMYALDRDELTMQAVGAYGVRADGYYGLALWMAQLMNGTLSFPVVSPEEDDTVTEAEYQAELEKWEELNLDNVNVYEQDLDLANELLSNAGWNLNENGETFNPETDSLRYRKGENGLEPLEFSLAYGIGSAAGSAIEQYFTEQLALVGIKLNVETISAQELMAEYYHQTVPTHDMLFLATNFTEYYDITGQFAVNENGEIIWAATGFEAGDLYRLVLDMNSTETGDFLAYTEKWIAFQELFMDELPVLPIYSNVYFDFYAGVLNDYEILANASWSQAINKAYLAEYTPEELEEDESGDDEILFDD